MNRGKNMRTWEAIGLESRSAEKITGSDSQKRGRKSHNG